MDAGATCGGVGGNAFGTKAALGFDPPDTIGGGVEAVLLLEVENGKDADRQGRQGETDGKDAGLKYVLHAGTGWLQHIKVQTTKQIGRHSQRIQ